MIKAEIIADSYKLGDTPGIKNSGFKVIFNNNNKFKRFMIIESTNGIQAYIAKDHEPVETGYEYILILDPAHPEDSCPLADLEVGVEWKELIIVNPESGNW